MPWRKYGTATAAGRPYGHLPGKATTSHGHRLH